MPFRFKDLVLDVQQYIIVHFLAIPDLLSVATVSRHYNHIATPAIYAYISLLLHISRLPIQWTQQEDNREALQDAQGRLLATLLARPELALHVKTLEWQVQLLSKSPPLWSSRSLDAPDALDEALPDSDEETSDPEDEPPDLSHIVRQRAELHEIFNTLLPLCRNVTKVHMASSIGHNPPPIPPMLFPRVTSVKLSSTSLDLVKSILHSPAQIAELSIDTAYPHESYIAILQWLANAPFEKLRRLSLRHGPIPEDDGHEYGWPEVEKILSAWKDFLLSSRGVLQEVLLGFKAPMPGCVGYGWEPGVAPRLESKFMEIVAPAFIGKEWPALHVLEIEGVVKFQRLWEPLEAAVPHLVMHHERKLVIEC